MSKKALASKVRHLAISSQAKRLERMNATWLALQKVMADRSVAHSDDKGGLATGLVLVSSRSVGSGANARIVEEYGLDTVLLRELRDLEEQAARELGQWNASSGVEVASAQGKVVIYLPDNGRGSGVGGRDQLGPLDAGPTD